MYTKRPTKQDLYNRIAALESLQQKQYEERMREKKKRWNAFLPIAYEMCREQLKKHFLNSVIMLHFEHVDEGGYWFTFKLVNDARTQTYAVRHHEVVISEN